MEISTETALPDFAEATSSREGALRATTTLRLKYEAERANIRRKLGDLEAIRGLTGLSQRKICQLLLVDPSAWSRWLKSGDAPPHIYRALQWYLALNEKYPAMDVGFWLNTAPRGGVESELTAQQLRRAEATQRELEVLRGDLRRLEDRLKTQRWVAIACAGLLAVSAFALIWLALR